jgi:hypothetical protein
MPVELPIGRVYVSSESACRASLPVVPQAISAQRNSPTENFPHSAFNRHRWLIPKPRRWIIGRFAETVEVVVRIIPVRETLCRNESREALTSQLQLAILNARFHQPPRDGCPS